MSLKLYTNLSDTPQSRDYKRKDIKPPTRATFGNEPRFTTLRSFDIENNQVVHSQEKIDKYCKIHDLGDVIWPCHPLLFVDNFDEVIESVKENDLYLFDIWGYVPGSGIEGDWKQFRPDFNRLKKIQDTLGDKWLGMDVGEQDGRYVLSYSSQMGYADVSHKEQYLNFQRHIQKICDDLGNKMVTLLAITLAHNEIKENGYTLIGAETAQMHPNGQVFYAFLRGAGKQYGVLWFGNASIYNRWGYKSYDVGSLELKEAKQAFPYGPTKGTSLSLLKRLIYNHILYNCALVGYESNWFENVIYTDEKGYKKVKEGDKLSPIGEIQHAAKDWVKTNGMPGTMLTQVAILRDLYSGWSFPNYNYQLYRIWGNRPYEAYDYYTDNLFHMFYPDYQNASFFEDETGFLTATPYGDIVDCLASDARYEMLRRYPILMVASKLEASEELKDKLENYIQEGGHLVICAGSLVDFKEIAGVSVTGNKHSYSQYTKVDTQNQVIEEVSSFELYELKKPQEAKVLASCQGQMAVIQTPYGKGCLTVIASPYGVGIEAAVGLPVTCNINEKLETPYPMLGHVTCILDEIFRGIMPFGVGKELSLITCRKDKGVYTLGIGNNTWEEKQLNILSQVGAIKKIEELTIDVLEKHCEGYLPECITQINHEIHSDYIAGGDIRIFRVEVEEEIEEIVEDEVGQEMTYYTLPLRDTKSIKETILLMPTFYDYFDSVLIDWRYIDRSEAKYLKEEGKWLRRQGVKIKVDLSTGLNLYPDLRLVNNDMEEYTKSMQTINRILEKMNDLGAKELLLCLHRMPENNITYEETEKSYMCTLRNMCEKAESIGITLYLKTQLKDQTAVELNPDSGIEKAKTNFFDMSLIALSDFIDRVGKTNLKLASSVALLLEDENPEDTLEIIRHNIGLWLVATTKVDVTGRVWNTHALLETYHNEEKLKHILSQIDKAYPVLLDGHYVDWDVIYREIKRLRNNLFL